MKILIFTEGTVIMHALAKGVSREERVRQSKVAAIQRVIPIKATTGSIYDFENYILLVILLKNFNLGNSKEQKLFI